jgi:hypothetical protein
MVMKPPKEPISTFRYFGGGLALITVLYGIVTLVSLNGDDAGGSGGPQRVDEQDRPSSVSRSETARNNFPLAGMNACTNALFDKFGGAADIDREDRHFIGASDIWAFKGTVEVHGRLHRWQCNLRGAQLIQVNTERIR